MLFSDRTENQPSKRKARLTMGTASADVYARVLLAVALGFFVLNKLYTWSDPWSIVDPLGPVSALEIIEAAILFSLCGRMRKTVAFAVEELCIIALTLCILAVVSSPKLAFGVMTVVFAVRLWSVAGAKPAVIGLLTLCAQLAASAGPLFALHRQFGMVDAAVVRGVTLLGGYATTGTGAVVIGPDGAFSIDVNAGCASSYVALGVLAGFVLVILWQRGRLVWADLLWAAALIALITLFNWARLVPMVFSHEAYLFWHDDLGAQMIALLDGVLTCGLALRAARKPDRDQRIRA